MPPCCLRRALPASTTTLIAVYATGRRRRASRYGLRADSECRYFTILTRDSYGGPIRAFFSSNRVLTDDKYTTAFWLLWALLSALIFHHGFQVRGCQRVVLRHYGLEVWYYDTPRDVTMTWDANTTMIITIPPKAPRFHRMPMALLLRQYFDIRDGRDETRLLLNAIWWFISISRGYYFRIWNIALFGIAGRGARFRLYLRVFMPAMMMFFFRDATI